MAQWTDDIRPLDPLDGRLPRRDPPKKPGPFARLLAWVRSIFQ